MKKIGDIMGDDMMEKFERAEIAMREKAKANAAIYGWDPDCECCDCGDTGYRLGGDEPCWCDVGRKIEEDRSALVKWKDSVPRRFQTFHLDTHPRKDVVEFCRKWTAQGFYQKKNLVLHGGYGSGKTGAAVGVLNEMYFDRDIKFIFTTFAEFLDQLKAGFDRHEVAEEVALTTFKLQRAPLLVIDDLGAEKPSEWVSERLYQIINDRYQWQRPTIVTTNFSKDEIEDRVGQRTADRIYDDAMVMEVDGNQRKTG